MSMLYDTKAKRYARYWRLMQNAPDMTNARDAHRVSRHLLDVIRASHAESLTNAHRSQLAAEAQRIWQQRHINMHRRLSPKAPYAAYRPAQSRNNMAANRLVRNAMGQVRSNRMHQQRLNANLANMRRRLNALKRG